METTTPCHSDRRIRMYPQWRNLIATESRKAIVHPIDPSSLRSLGMTMWDGCSLGMTEGDVLRCPANESYTTGSRTAESAVNNNKKFV